MLRHLGQAGVEPLLELCRHRHAEARAQAVNSLRLQFDRCGDSRLIAELLQMLVDPSSSVTYNAVGLVKGLPRKMLSLAPAGLVEALPAGFPMTGSWLSIPIIPSKGQASITMQKLANGPSAAPLVCTVLKDLQCG